MMDLTQHSNITKIIIPDGVQKTNNYTRRFRFSNMPNLISATLPNSVVNYMSTFSNCKNLISVSYNERDVIDLSYTYEDCVNFIGPPKCGDKVYYFSNTYRNCYNLTGTPVCGIRVILMSNTYENCYNITGSPVCGKNVKRMDTTYKNCYNLTGSPICGERVITMRNTYDGCHNLTGSPVCGNNVANMYYTYNGCTNLTGSPVCGPNVTDMSCTYRNCYNLTGTPVCGDNVTTMSSTYYYCNNITGSSVCGNNVTNMSNTYFSCTKLTGSPTCGDSVVNLQQTYYCCFNLTGSPVCGDKVTDMYKTYYNCRNITGVPVCGNNVIYMEAAYRDCWNLTGSAMCGPNVVNVAYAYFNCQNIAQNAYFYSNKISTARSCFGQRNISNPLHLYVPVNSQTLNTVLFTNSYSLVGNSITWTDDYANSGCYYNTQYNINIYPVKNVMATQYLHKDGIYLEKISDTRLDINTTKQYTVSYLVLDKTITPQVTINSDVETIINFSNITINSDNIDFTVTTLSPGGIANITMTITQGEYTATNSFTITIAPEHSSYSVETVSNASYDFILNSSQYYESQNKGIRSSCALCKVKIISNGTSNMLVDCINHAESNYDYGLLSQLDTTLTSSASADSNTKIFKSFKGLSNTSVQTVDYGIIPPGEHFIYVKFIKDSSGNNGNDSLQFKITLT